MIISRFNGLKIAGIACCVPTQADDLSTYRTVFDDETVDKFQKSTGVQNRFVSMKEQTASDLAYVAAEKLLEEKKIEKASIGALIFVSECPDYHSPATAFVLQKRLGLPLDCIVFDINLGCSAFVYGLSTLASLMTTSNVNRALLLFGDTMTKYVAPTDKAACMLFGDASGALLLEKNDIAEDMCFRLKSDGYNYKTVLIQGGGFRYPDAPKERVLWGDGNYRSDHDFYMDGANVFSFSTFEAPALIKEHMEAEETSADCYDALLLHQANQFIINRIGKRLKFPPEKVICSITQYGNTSGASIPVAAVSAFGDVHGKKLRILSCGFGVGLSWGTADFYVEADDILPMIHSDDYYDDGIISHG